VKGLLEPKEGQQMKISGILPVGAVCAGLLLAGAAQAQNEAIANGRLVATRQCSRCHAIGSTGASPLREAPVFRTILARYRRDVLEVELIQHMQVGHAAMPDFQFNPAATADLLAYLDSIQVKTKAGTPKKP
jgi:mono/diheme cytochrome c family protein